MRIRTICAGIALVVAALLTPSAMQAVLLLEDCIGGQGFNTIVFCGDPGAPPAKGVNLLQEAPGSPIAIPAGVSSLRLVDANGDGSLDVLLVVNQGTGNTLIDVRPGDGQGGFGPPIQTLIEEFSGISAVGDVNMDGRPDVVSLRADSGLDQNIRVLIGTGTGQFEAGPVIPVSGLFGTRGIAVANVTGDSSPDIVTMSQAGGTINVFSGDGSGSFTFHEESPGTQFFTPSGGAIVTSAFALTDVNGDGNLDVLINATGAAVRYGDGFGSFGPPVVVGAPQTYLQGIGSSIAGADVNGDGFVDIVHYDGTQFRVTLNGPSGFGTDTSIYQAVPNPTVGFSTSMAIADLDGDGALDLFGMVTEWVEGTPLPQVSVLFGDGAGAFTNPSFYAAGKHPFAAVGDLNGDARPDVVAFGRVDFADSSELTVLLHVSGVGLNQLSAAIGALGLPAGTANALQAKVKAAGASRERGNLKATANQLNALINQIDALNQSGRLTSAQASSLIALTQQVIAGL